MTLTFRSSLSEALAYGTILSTVLSTSCYFGAYEREQRRLHNQRELLTNVPPERVQKWIDRFEDAARKYQKREHRR